jgi:hypothetical protein
MTLQVKTYTNSVSDINMDSEKVEALCFPLLFPSGERGYTNASKGRINPNGYAMARLLRPEKHGSDYLTAQARYAPFKNIDIRAGEPFTPTHQERCHGEFIRQRTLKCAHEGCIRRTHKFCQADWLEQHCYQVN